MKIGKEEIDVEKAVFLGGPYLGLALLIAKEVLDVIPEEELDEVWDESPIEGEEASG